MALGSKTDASLSTSSEAAWSQAGGPSVSAVDLVGGVTPNRLLRSPPSALLVATKAVAISEVAFRDEAAFEEASEAIVVASEATEVGMAVEVESDTKAAAAAAVVGMADAVATRVRRMAQVVVEVGMAPAPRTAMTGETATAEVEEVGMEAATEVVMDVASQAATENLSAAETAATKTEIEIEIETAIDTAEVVVDATMTTQGNDRMRATGMTILANAVTDHSPRSVVFSTITLYYCTLSSMVGWWVLETSSSPSPDSTCHDHLPPAPSETSKGSMASR